LNHYVRAKRLWLKNNEKRLPAKFACFLWWRWSTGNPMRAPFSFHDPTFFIIKKL
jgi:hypothetical protein